MGCVNAPARGALNTGYCARCFDKLAIQIALLVIGVLALTLGYVYLTELPRIMTMSSGGAVTLLALFLIFKGCGPKRVGGGIPSGPATEGAAGSAPATGVGASTGQRRDISGVMVIQERGSHFWHEDEPPQERLGVTLKRIDGQWTIPSQSALEKLKAGNLQTPSEIVDALFENRHPKYRRVPEYEQTELGEYLVQMVRMRNERIRPNQYRADTYTLLIHPPARYEYPFLPVTAWYEESMWKFAGDLEHFPEQDRQDPDFYLKIVSGEHPDFKLWERGR